LPTKLKSDPTPATTTSRRSWQPAAGRSRTRALGYATVPAGAPPADADAQRLTIEAACNASGLQLADFVVEHSALDERVELQRAFARFETGELSCLIVSGLERLSGSVDELASIIDRLEKQHVRLIALDVGLDTATPTGRLAVSLRDGEPEPEPEPEAEAEPEPELEPPAPAPPEPAVEVAAPVAIKAFGYASVERGADDASEKLERQRELIEQKCQDLGLELVGLVRDREPKDGKALDRPGLSDVLARIAAGEASCIVVRGLERLSRSVADLGALVRWFEQNDVRLIVVELDLDTATSGGHTTARALATLASLERDRLSERTRQGLAAARAKRRAAAGPGQPDWAALRTRIAAMRADGMTLQAIADALNDEGIPTQRGGAKWRPSSVQTAAGYKRRARPSVVEQLPPVQHLAHPGEGGNPPG
jgi:DNA invertase Pin-like site-specific DNA recombinase